MFYHKWLIYICIGLLVVGCQQLSKDSKRFELLKASETGVEFQNTINDPKLNVFEYVNMYNGAGVGVGDFDNDGYEDLFFAGNLVSSKLYLNNGKTKPFSFLDKTKESGVMTNSWVNGVAVVDIDQDGWDDIYCSVSGGKSGRNRPNLLFVNKGLDSNGQLRFEEEAVQYHLNDTTHTIQSAFFDYDGDDDLDVFMIVNHPTGYLGQEANRITRIKEQGRPERTDRLYRNDGMGTDGYPIFTDVSRKAGITLEGFSLGLAINDFNEDGKPDIYVANDYVTNDILYINNGDGTFTDRICDYVNHTSFASMGIDVSDINNDGWQDYMVLDMLPQEDVNLKMMYPAINHIGFDLRKKIGYVDQYNRNTLQLNNGLKDSIPRKFSEIGRFSNVSDTNWSWSTLMPDLDLDGWRDIFITNGFLKDVNDLDFVNYDDTDPFGNQKKRNDDTYLESLKTQKGIHIPNRLFRNQGNLRFEDKSDDWGFMDPSYSNGAAYADFDNDGDLDLAINNINETAFIFKNNTISSDNKENNYLQIRLEGEEPNTGAIGAKISFESSRGISSYVNYPTRGFMSSVSSIVNFGLGKDSVVNHLHITWPDGTLQSLENVKANQRVTVQKRVNENEGLITKSDQSPLFEDLKIDGLDYAHQEMSFNDFDYQTLIPFKLSKLGPCLAVGDIDNNKLDDIYIGGAKGAIGKLFFQEEQGKFSSFELEDSKLHEDQASLLIDVDNDGDLDIYIASGGVENGRQSRYYVDRLWVNTGNRTFESASLDLPRANASCAVASDYDKDGDLDIFVGGASLPESYPLAAQSMLLQNNTVTADVPAFVDLGNTLLPELKDLGIVRSALWSDYDNDGWQDLLIVGEFMPLVIFKNEKGRLVRVAEKNLPPQKGIWNSINGHDLDQDGDIDYVLGNFGLNSKYKPTEQEPVKIYAEDFDQNGIIDPIMTYFSDEREVPVHLRDDLFKQLIGLKKKMPTYKQYAEASITDVISKEILKNATTLEWNYTSSVCLMNNGSEGFEIVPLPTRAQIAPIYGTLIEDFNGDGFPDILAVGNSHGVEVFSGWQDSSFGTLLVGNGDGTFQTIENYDTSGFYINGEAKALVNVKRKDGSYLTLVSKNDDSLEIFSASLRKVVKSIDLETFDQKAKISYYNGKTEIREFYYGSGYYSQSTRSFPITEKMKMIEIFDTDGKTRDVLTVLD
ncbi:VCBS repeat-containing protein [Ulvibacterium sp.]|uniref:VCBS repeat-containing protein n=1 Tax=Ulvibacterium sp. TaxID=2665914 RepID=UPI003BACB072